MKRSPTNARRLTATLGLLLFLALGALVPGGLARGDDTPTPEAVGARIEALDVKGAEELLDKLRTDARTPEARESVKSLERELDVAKKLAPVSKKMEKLYEEKKLRECYAAFVAAADAFPRALALEGLRENAREARRQAFFVIDDFDGDVAQKADEPKPDASPRPDEPKPDASPKPDEPKPDEPKPDEPKPDEPKPDEPRPDEPKPDAVPEKPSADGPASHLRALPLKPAEGEKKPKKPALHWTAHNCAGEVVLDPMRGWALRWTVDTFKRRAFWDRTLKEPLDLTAYEYFSIRVRGTTVPKKAGGLSVGFGDNTNNFLEAVLAVEPDGKWHELHFPIADLKRNGAPDASSLPHVTLHYKGVEAVDIEVDELLLAKNKKP